MQYIYLVILEQVISFLLQCCSHQVSFYVEGPRFYDDSFDILKATQLFENKSKDTNQTPHLENIGLVFN